jgi:hypothetical protein
MDEHSETLVIDQRLMTRPIDGNGDGISICDIGSYELQSPITPTPITGTPSPTVTTATPTRTPTATPGTRTPTPTVTPTFTPTLVCSEAIINGNFEKDEGWYLPITKYSAGYDSSLVKAAAADYSADEFHSGARSMRTGIVDASKNVYSYSSAWQQVTIPSGIKSANLTFWLFPQTINGIDGFDVQLMIILNNNKLEVERPVNMRSNERIWKSFQFDMKKYAGQTVWIYFGTYNNGWTGTMAMYVDDVSLMICK